MEHPLIFSKLLVTCHHLFALVGQETAKCILRSWIKVANCLKGWGIPLRVACPKT